MLYSGGIVGRCGSGGWNADDTENMCLCMDRFDRISCDERK